MYIVLISLKIKWSYQPVYTLLHVVLVLTRPNQVTPPKNNCSGRDAPHPLFAPDQNFD